MAKTASYKRQRTINLGDRMARAKAEGVDTAQNEEGLHKIIQEIIALERLYYFEKKNVTSERQRKVKEIIERHTAGAEE